MNSQVPCFGQDTSRVNLEPKVSCGIRLKLLSFISPISHPDSFNLSSLPCEHLLTNPLHTNTYLRVIWRMQTQKALEITSITLSKGYKRINRRCQMLTIFYIDILLANSSFFSNSNSIAHALVHHLTQAFLL